MTMSDSILAGTTPAGPSGQSVLNSLHAAAAKTGVSFEFLIKTARTESSLNPNARAQGSSAAGLFQFVEQTWLASVKTYGDKFGLDAHAAHISKTSRGTYVVNDPLIKEQILDLRFDPEIAATMAASLADENREILEKKLGREVSDGEVYLAHFLGAGNATRILQSDHGVRAADLFPAAARANPAIFFADGIARTTGEVLSRLGIVLAPEKPAITPPLSPEKQNGSFGTAPLPAVSSLPGDLGKAVKSQPMVSSAPVQQAQVLPADLSPTILSILLLFDPLIARGDKREERRSL